MDCPHCLQNLPERGSFCPNCGKQTRCRQCRDILEPGASACVECGTLVGQGIPGINGGHNAVDPKDLPNNRNTITYREDRNSRDFHASLTDNSMQSVGTVLAEVFAQRGTGRINPPGSSAPSKHQSVVDAVKTIAAPEDETDNTPPPAPPEPSPAVAPELTRVSEIFRANGDTLELIENRLKAKSGMDYVRRLTYLFLYAHELHGRGWTPRADVFAVLKEGKVLNGNSRFWIGKKQGFRVDAENNMQLIQGGREEAKKALNEALDPNATDEWHPDKKTVTKRGPRKKKA